MIALTYLMQALCSLTATAAFSLAVYCVEYGFYQMAAINGFLFAFNVVLVFAQFSIRADAKKYR